MVDQVMKWFLAIFLLLFVIGVTRAQPVVVGPCLPNGPCNLSGGTQTGIDVSGDTVTATGGETHSLATWFQGLAKSGETLELTQAASPARNFSLNSGNPSVTFPVPAFRPTTAGQNLALDLFPSAGATEFSDNGYAWMDICDNPSANSTCMRAGGITSTGAVTGINSFGTATPLGYRFRINGSDAAAFDATGHLIVNTNLGVGNSVPTSGRLQVTDISRPFSAAQDGLATTLKLTTGTGKNTDRILAAGINDADNYAWIQAVQNGTGFLPLLLQAGGGDVLIGSHTDDGSGDLQVTGTSAFHGATVSVPSSVTISTSTFTPAFTASNNFNIKLVHASCPCAIANPSTTPIAGQSGMIAISQSATGSDTVSTWGSQYKFAGGTPPTLSTGANAVDFFPYYVFTSTQIIVGAGVLNAH
jgi:hypothetical protein